MAMLYVFFQGQQGSPNEGQMFYQRFDGYHLVWDSARCAVRSAGRYVVRTLASRLERWASSSLPPGGPSRRAALDHVVQGWHKLAPQNPSPFQA